MYRCTLFVTPSEVESNVLDILKTTIVDTSDNKQYSVSLDSLILLEKTAKISSNQLRFRHGLAYML